MHNHSGKDLQSRSTLTIVTNDGIGKTIDNLTIELLYITNINPSLGKE